MNILMIAYRFPPASDSGTFRPMYFAHHLQNLGEQVSVLTVREQDYLAGQVKDDNLLRFLDHGVKIFHARVFRPREAILDAGSYVLRRGPAAPPSAFSPPRPNEQAEKPTVQPPYSPSKTSSIIQWFREFIIDYLSIPDAQIGWLPPAVSAGVKIVRDNRIDVIYATGGPWTSLLIGVALRRITRKPVIIDFRDPWIANPYRNSTRSAIRAIEARMERTVLNMADHIITNTKELQQDFLARYPKLSPQKLTTIPNGFEDYVAGNPASAARDCLTFTHAGTLYSSRNPRCLLQAIFNLIEHHGIPHQALRFVFLGGLDELGHDQDLYNLVQHPVLRDVIRIVPRVPYQEAVAYQQQSDILLLLQPDFPLQVPRKLYEYMAFRKPILAITNASGATARTIQDHNFGIVVENQTTAIEIALKTCYQQWKNGDLPHLATEHCDAFLNKQLTLTLHGVFRGCLENRSGIEANDGLKVCL
ncbi:MAG: glycosyltransferase [Lentisphaerae bacterium]|nr:glycosyltransferase [Lentisphaerota bacterium]